MNTNHLFYTLPSALDGPGEFLGSLRFRSLYPGADCFCNILDVEPIWESLGNYSMDTTLVRQ